MKLKEILASFSKNFGFFPVFGVEFEFFTNNIFVTDNIIKQYEKINLIKEKNLNQYELIYDYNKNALDLINLFDIVKKKSQI